MKKWFAILPLCWLLAASAAHGQVPDSLQAAPPAPTFDTVAVVDTTPPLPDSLAVAKKPGFLKRVFTKEDYPNPDKALFLALALPGAGQAYNKRYWKMPIVYAGYGLLIYSARFNSRNYRRLRDAYIAELNDEPHEFEGLGLDANDLRRLRDGYDKNKQLSYIGIFALHLVQAAEAFVDCHLKTFDVSDDLSLQVGPSLQYFPAQAPTPGIGLTLRIK